MDLSSEHQRLRNEESIPIYYMNGPNKEVMWLTIGEATRKIT